MLHAFRPHASEFGFFLDWEWFRSGTRHSSALLNAIYMWGAHISSDRHREQHFMRKALRCAAGELTPTSFMRSIQAEVLLSFFFFRTDCLLEARAHSAKAVTLVIAGRLHQIGSLTQSDWTAADIAVVDGRKLLLPAPANAFEEGDRINGFWAVFVLQQSLFVVLEPSTPACGVFDSGAGGINIDTPWPLDTCDARQEVYGESTVRNYLSGLPDCQVVPSVAAMSVKASILFHHAVLMHRKWRPNLPEPETASWWAAFHVTNQLIDALLSELPNASQLRGRSSPRTIMLSRSLLHAATIKLHSVFDDASSKQIRLPAAQAMSSLDGVTLHELEYVSPLIPTLWAMGSSVLVQDMGWVGAANLVPQACPTPASSRPSSSRKSEKPVVAVTFPAAAFD
ncbi:hypothetical protein C8R47DRAFT_1109042 [Mycena vitilis]|nr:hypothetical protein C8R47DRAFT_1109042 [Mycena vitilis]